MALVAAPLGLPSSVPTALGPPRDILLRLTGHGAAVTGLSWHPTSAVLASSSFDSTAIIWSVATVEEAPALAHLTGHKASVTAVAFADGGDALATASADRTGALYDAVTAQRTRTLKGHTSHVTCVDGGAGLLDRRAGGVVTGGNDRKVCVWDGRERRQEAGIVLQHEYQVLDVAFGAEEWSLLSAGIDPRVFVWDTRRPGEPVRYLEAHGEAVTGLCMSPLGERVASYGADGRVGIWDVRPFVEGERLERALDCGGGGFEMEMLRVGWDCGGTRVAAGDGGGEVTVWDAADGEVLACLGGHEGSVNDVKFCPIEDTLVASASSDCSIIVGHLPLPTD